MSYVDVSTVYGSTFRKQDVIAARARRAEVASFMRLCQQKGQVETRALQQRGRDSQALEQQRARERDREAILQEQRRAARQRRSRAERLRRDAFGPDSLFADGVVSVPALFESVPVAPAEVGIPGLSDVPRGVFSAAEAVPLRGLRRGSTNLCYVISSAQVMMRTPGMFEWLQKHNEDGCPHERTSCVLCGLFLTWTQIFAGWSRGAEYPRLAERRHHVADVFANNEQQDAAAFIEGFLDKVRQSEIAAGRCARWGHVRLTGPRVATHVDRLYGFVLEERRRCTGACQRVMSWYTGEFVLKLPVGRKDGGPMTLVEMYLASCGKVDMRKMCDCCGRDTTHEEQRRICGMPNVLVVQVSRQNDENGRLVREPVSVEERLILPGLDAVDLVGVIYHTGPTVDRGHYTCLCRGPDGGFWFYDDDCRSVKMTQEVAHFRPRNVHVVVYARREQRWSTDVVVGGDENLVFDLEDGRGAGDYGGG